MNHVESVTRLSSSSSDQLRQLQNAFRVLAKPGHKLRAQANWLRQEVSSAWHIQAVRREWFPWPTTIASRGTRQMKGGSWWPHGMLSFLGYHVGECDPTPLNIRRCILEYAFECHLPPLNDVEYFLGWGEPLTARRLAKLADTLAALTRNAKRRDLVAYATAIADWEEDLVFLHERYYINFFHFGWPATDPLNAATYASDWDWASPLTAEHTSRWGLHTEPLIH